MEMSCPRVYKIAMFLPHSHIIGLQQWPTDVDVAVISETRSNKSRKPKIANAKAYIYCTLVYAFVDGAQFDRISNGLLVCDLDNLIDVCNSPCTDK